MLTTVITLTCSWCQRAFERPPGGVDDSPDYCSRLHREWAERIERGEYPVTDCPRCGRHDLRIAAPDWAICQTCGHQTDRTDLPAGLLTPRNMNRSMSDIKERLAQHAEK